jgi:hypothetical protein
VTSSSAAFLAASSLLVLPMPAKPLVTSFTLLSMSFLISVSGATASLRGAWISFSGSTTFFWISSDAAPVYFFSSRSILPIFFA